MGGNLHSRVRTGRYSVLEDPFQKAQSKMSLMKASVSIAGKASLLKGRAQNKSVINQA